MHVVMVAKYPFPGVPTTGGVERVVEILRRNVAKHAKVTLLVPNAMTPMNFEDEAGAISYLEAPSVPDFLGYWSVTSKALYERIEKLRPDIVHVQDLAGLAFSWPRGVDVPWRRLVFTAHGLLDKDIMSQSAHDWLRKASAPFRAWLISAVERRSRARYDHHVVINDYVLSSLPDLQRMSWRSIANPVDRVFLDEPRNERASGSHYELLQVGVVNPRKNTLSAIEIICELLAGGLDVRLNILGPVTDAAYADHCKQAARTWGVADAVNFRGAVKPVELAAWMDRSDALLLTSRQETAPLVIAEAHCRGLPTAAPRAFGLPSMVDEHFNGVLMDDVTPRAQAACVRRLLERKFDRDRIRAEAITRYGVDPIVRQTLAFYDAALAAPPAGRRARG